MSGEGKFQYYIDDYNRRSATLSKKTGYDERYEDRSEMYARGFEFEPLDIYKAQATKFLIVNGKLMPRFPVLRYGERRLEAVAEASKDGESSVAG